MSSLGPIWDANIGASSEVSPSLTSTVQGKDPLATKPPQHSKEPGSMQPQMLLVRVGIGARAAHPGQAQCSQCLMPHSPVDTKTLSPHSVATVHCAVPESWTVNFPLNRATWAGAKLAPASMRPRGKHGLQQKCTEPKRTSP